MDTKQLTGKKLNIYDSFTSFKLIFYNFLADDTKNNLTFMIKIWLQLNRGKNFNIYSEVGSSIIWRDLIKGK